MVLHAARFTKEQILCLAVNCGNAVLAVAAFVIGDLELFLVWSRECHLVHNRILTGSSDEVIKLKHVLLGLRLNENRIALGDIKIGRLSDLAQINFTNKESQNLVLVVEKLLYVNVPTLEDDIFEWKGFGYQLVWVLFGKVGDIDHGSMGGFLSLNQIDT